MWYSNVNLYLYNQKVNDFFKLRIYFSTQNYKIICIKFFSNIFYKLINKFRICNLNN
jgi:hypothetical protein